MRKYIRHPSDIPIEYHLGDVAPQQKQYMYNISEGGLSFQCDVCIKRGTEIKICIPIRKPLPEITGIVVWCHKRGSRYNIGVKFTDVETAFRARMVEQVCHIEQYRKEVYEKEGRRLSGEEAAAEWIGKFAKDFPYVN